MGFEIRRVLSSRGGRLIIAPLASHSSLQMETITLVHANSHCQDGGAALEKRELAPCLFASPQEWCEDNLLRTGDKPRILSEQSVAPVCHFDPGRGRNKGMIAAEHCAE